MRWLLKVNDFNGKDVIVSTTRDKNGRETIKVGNLSLEFQNPRHILDFAFLSNGIFALRTKEEVYGSTSIFFYDKDLKLTKSYNSFYFAKPELFNLLNNSNEYYECDTSRRIPQAEDDYDYLIAHRYYINNDGTITDKKMYEYKVFCSVQ